MNVLFKCPLVQSWSVVLPTTARLHPPSLSGLTSILGLSWPLIGLWCALVRGWCLRVQSGPMWFGSRVPSDRFGVLCVKGGLGICTMQVCDVTQVCVGRASVALDAPSMPGLM
jgi:hypothetical protein